MAELAVDVDRRANDLAAPHHDTQTALGQTPATVTFVAIYACHAVEETLAVAALPGCVSPSYSAQPPT
jgi:hypothetical protein